MQAYYNGFWNGFHTKHDPVHEGFFSDLLTKVFELPVKRTTSIEDADILVESIFTNSPAIKLKAWKYSILFSGESRISSESELYSAVLWIKNDLPKYVALPLFIPYITCNNLEVQLRAPKSIVSVPTKMACAVISNPLGAVRNSFIDALQARGICVINGGSYKNTLGHTIGGSYNSSSMIDFMKQFKFVISMENSSGEYYITEKIIHGMVAGTVPIYWGTEKVFEYFNKDRFLYLNDDSHVSINNLIDSMLSMTDDQYLYIVNQPTIIKEELLGPIIDKLKGSIMHM